MGSSHLSRKCLLVLWIWLGGFASQDRLAAEETAEPVPPEQLEFFESRIRPVLVKHCYACHAADSKTIRGGLLLDSRAGMLRGGDLGPALVPGDSSESLLLSALRHESLEMPPKGKLPEAVIKDFELWIDRGAADPRGESIATATSGIDPAAARDHWAFQPIQTPTIPRGALSDSWVRNPIDAFVWQKLEQRGWRPAAEADKYTLIRRATFDLIGLPPSEQELEAFLADDSPASFERVIDRLLASPHYGQRWGRHWLDLVRYADTNGADENHAMPNAWRYRDWTIRALNQDLSLDQFIVQQLAGDLLPPPSNEEAAADLLIATGMLVIGPKMLAEQDKEKMRIDIVDEQIDTVSRTMLGMTIACARCHDHKFDPISSEDYYALAGIFASTRTMLNEDFVSKWMERDLPSQRIAQLRQQHQQRMGVAKTKLDDMVDQANDDVLCVLQQNSLPKKPEQHYPEAVKQQITAARQALEQLEKAMPKFASAMAVAEASTTNLPVHIRGDHLRKADKGIPRGVPRRLRQVVPIRSIPDQASGRLQLARWLTSPDHPLTARVMANRLWMWHFGQPLMRSPSNFGLQSSPPVHRDLLDWLSRR
ncbi:MAG: PSD1 and planctomycete cytochrome C domain-containing protein, partial [Pirellulales bacterium]|nr:PSD1 and planctomycete cytochrome C domain-containing protein [Pirellulales bacterium]